MRMRRRSPSNAKSVRFPCASTRKHPSALAQRASSVEAEQEGMAMKFGIHNSSWVDSPDPAEAFEAAKAKARWTEDHGFVWFSVLIT